MGVIDWLVGLPIVVSMLVQIAAWALFGLAAAWVSTRFYHPEIRQRGSSSLSRLLGVVTGLYAFLIGFLIVQEWSNVNTARSSLSREAAALSTTGYDALLFPEQDFARVRGALVAYNRSIVCDELPRLARGEKNAPETALALERVYKTVAGLPATTRALPSFGNALGSIAAAASERRNRLSAATLRLPAVLLVLVIVTALTLVCVHALQEGGHQRTHVLSIVVLAVFVGFAIGLVVELSRPYAGAAKIGDQPLRLGVEPEELRCP